MTAQQELDSAFTEVGTRLKSLSNKIVYVNDLSELPPGLLVDTLVVKRNAVV